MALQSLPIQFVATEITNAAATYSTVPANTISLVRQVHATNKSSSPATVTVYFDAGFGSINLMTAYPLQPGAFVDLYLYLPLLQGTLIKALASVNTAIDLIITGDNKTLA